MAVTELHNILAQNGGFIRVGSAYIINLRCVRNITSSQVHLHHGTVIPIPRGKYREIKNAFWDFQYEGQEE
jgi:DNA-binding LytR/AlgR family response regulator